MRMPPDSMKTELANALEELVASARDMARAAQRNAKRSADAAVVLQKVVDYMHGNDI